MARIVQISAHQVHRLDSGWQMASAPPASIADPSGLADAPLSWRPAEVPGTVATALRGDPSWHSEASADLDSQDWWFRGRFTVADPAAPGQLRFGGLASLAEVWCNGVPLLASENMFLAHRATPAGLRADNEICVCFRALKRRLDQRRPRPRWRPRLINHPQLRWVRTTLLGRMPGWCPVVAPVGPYRPIEWVATPTLQVERLEMRSHIEEDRGVVDLRVPLAAAALPTAAWLMLGESRTSLAVVATGPGTFLVEGRAVVPSVQRWWPHTHGDPHRYPAQLHIAMADGQEVHLEMAPVGFRTLDLHTETAESFEFRINGVPIFCRGACWTSPDILALAADAATYRRLLTRARDGGLNMMRVGGTMIYEDDLFYDLCDELGILVWQDFMFANMDYPAEDAPFRETVKEEARQLLDRLQARPSLALLCGNSEVEQQAAMLGLPRGHWSNEIFQQILPDLVRQICPDVPYWPSSPSGGALPFSVNAHASHYYGVGAYLRPLEDARRAEVRFAAECLAFSNIPDAATLDLLGAAALAPGHHPLWKARVPRDIGVGWDFEDVRDHYVAQLFGVDPAQLRYRDPERYLALGRAAMGEVMTATFAEWRRLRSSCRGGLVWTFQDLLPGAGWGILDALGKPKSVYYHLKRAWQPVGLFLSDEGQNGVSIHLVNDTAAPVEAELALTLLRDGHVVVGQGQRAVTIPPRAALELPAELLLERFSDTAYAYRFGPPGHDVVMATLTTTEGEAPRQAFLFPTGMPATPRADLDLQATAVHAPDGALVVTVSSRRLALAVRFEAEGFVADDSDFHLSPSSPQTILLRPSQPGLRFTGRVEALNATGSARIPVG